MSSQNIHIVADSKIPFLRGLLEPYAQVSYYEPNEITNTVVRDADNAHEDGDNRYHHQQFNDRKRFFHSIFLVCPTSQL